MNEKQLHYKQQYKLDLIRSVPTLSHLIIHHKANILRHVIEGAPHQVLLRGTGRIV